MTYIFIANSNKTAREQAMDCTHGPSITSGHGAGAVWLRPGASKHNRTLTVSL